MNTGLLFLAGILSLIGGILIAKDKKPLARGLFGLSLAAFAAGGLFFSLEKSGDSQLVKHFESGGVLECRSGGALYTVSLADGWTLRGGDHFVKDETIARAGVCEAVQ